jgi:hypothetical protein
MDNVDKRGRLDETVFTYRVSKDGTVFIAFHGKQVTVVKGDKARKLLAQLANADRKTEQLALAKATGNFKHGNER